MAKRLSRAARANKAKEPPPPEPGPMALPTIRGEPFNAEGKKIDTKPTDLKQYKGSHKYKFSGDKDERFGLQVVEDDPRGNTHHLKSEDHYWEGTERQFKDQFE